MSAPQRNSGGGNDSAHAEESVRLATQSGVASLQLEEEVSQLRQQLRAALELRDVLDASEIGTVVVDRDMRVRLFTPAAASAFNLLPTDMGRPLSDVIGDVRWRSVHEDVRRVLTEVHGIDREVESADGRWHLLRLRPSRTTDDRIDGVGITLQDITDRRAAEQRLQASEERMRQLIDSAVDYAILTITHDGHIDSWNTGAQRMFGFATEEIVGQPLDLLFTPEDRVAGVPAAELARAASDGRADDERFHVRKNGERFYCSGVTFRLSAPGGFTKIARDLTDQRKAADALKDAHARLEQRVEDRTRALQTELLERATAQEQATSLLRKLVTSQEDERARIARDLHDQLGQQLTALRLTLERVAARRGDDREVAQAIEIAHALDAELGFLAWELRPPALDDIGLAAALPRYVKEWSQHYGTPAEYRSSAFQAGQLSRQAETAFYRIAQEALTNVAKHAHASRVDVILETRNRSVLLLVEDDGVGFSPSAPDVKQRGIGLEGMRERAALVGATLQIEAAPRKGTSLFLRCPVA